MNSGKTKVLTGVDDSLQNPSMFPLFNFNKLENKGERIDIDMTKQIHFEDLNVFQKIHYTRYQFIANEIEKDKYNLDIACGTGYGTIMLSIVSKFIEGYDIDKFVIDSISKRYATFTNVKFGIANILELNFSEKFHNIISFETLEHFSESEIGIILKKYHSALQPNGFLFFSTPYQQKNDIRMKILGHHKTFDIDEAKISHWLKQNGFEVIYFKYQNYNTNNVTDSAEIKDIIICKAKKL